MGGTQKMLTVSLFLACLQGILLQQPGTGPPRKPFFERFRRLEEQFRRFQEITLLRLQEIAGNYNISYNIDAKFDHLQREHNSLKTAANRTHAEVHEEMHQLKVWVKKLQKRSKQQGLKVAAMEETLREGGREKERSGTLISNLSQGVARGKEEGQAMQTRLGSLQKAVEGLQDALKTQGSKLSELEQQQAKSPVDNEALLAGGPPPLAQLLSQPSRKEPEAAAGQKPSLKKLRSKHRQRKKLQEESSRLAALAQSRGTPTVGSQKQEQKVPPGSTPGPATSPAPEPQPLKQPNPMVEDVGSEVPKGPRQPGKICNVGSMLLFPNMSTENFATFHPSFVAGLLEFSLCTWVSTRAHYLGTILSYATEENDNKLVLHGRDAAPRNSVHFVIGDPAFRELPVGRILDGKWHHICAVWSSLQGRYWFYVDRRVASMGSKFRKGYEIPPGGSLLLGQEQDTPGGGFEPSESFVGSLAGFGLWDRALSPGEISGIATGKGLPRRPVLTLSNVSALHGAVQKVACTCLEHCL